ncbi:MAG: hypothetical protein HWE23_11655 [Rhodobacteraceae bacterium]|nr:hypothetical protein [Paracoccaceae bacterium]
MPNNTSRASKAAGFGFIRPAAGARTKEDWIGNQLKQVYDEALSEDIPSDMMDLLSALDDSETQEQETAEESSK